MPEVDRLASASLVTFAEWNRIPTREAIRKMLRFQVSFMDTLMPWPALALWVWQASPAMNTCSSRLPISATGTSSNLPHSRWPIS